MKIRVLSVAFWQMVVRDAGIQVMDVVEADISAEPVQHSLEAGRTSEPNSPASVKSQLSWRFQ